jgi:hypothetical protein
MGDEFDGSISLGRKLSTDETRELRITLLPYFHAEGGMESDDINDFLDYILTMVSNAKTIEHIVKELDEFCSPDISKKIGRELAQKIRELNGESTGSANEDNKAEAGTDGDGMKGTSRKVSIDRVICGSLLTVPLLTCFHQL